MLLRFQALLALTALQSIWAFNTKTYARFVRNRVSGHNLPAQATNAEKPGFYRTYARLERNRVSGID